MNFKCNNYELTLQEDLQALEEEIKELEKLNNLILESNNYDLLSGKTQLMDKNKTDNVRSRKVHSENIAILCQRFIKSLYEAVVDDEVKSSPIYKLNLKRDLLYAQIVSLTHDWGHVPFGHLGERVISTALQNTVIEEKNLKKILARKRKIYGEDYETQQGHIPGSTKKISFEHNEQSAKMFYDFVKVNNIDLNKIDLQRIINAILAHSTSRVKSDSIPNDLIAQIIRQFDKLEEYTINDFEEIKDFIELDCISDTGLCSYLQLPSNEKIKITLQQLLSETLEKGSINDEMDSLKYSRIMKKIHHKYIFMMDTDGKRGLLTGENEERITLILRKIMDYYLAKKNPIPQIFSYASKLENIAPEEKIIDYICMMDNRQIERIYTKLIMERLLRGENYGIEPIHQEEIAKTMKDTFDREVELRKLKESLEGVEHSTEECAASLKEEIESIKYTCLTKNALDRMKKVRTAHRSRQ